MEVTILNPEVLEHLYLNHGEFARTCYDTDEKYAEKVGRSCEESGHMSGSRCEYIKFRIEGIDRGTAEQIMRHEIGTSVPHNEMDNWSFSDYSEAVIDVSPDQIVKNMASFRYIDKSGFDYVVPGIITKDRDALDKYQDIMNCLNIERENLKNLLLSHGADEKKVIEAVNFILPRATTSILTVGFTPEALIHFCHKRLCSRAQEFIRKITKEMKQEVAKYNPIFASELVPHCQHLLWCPEGKMSCGAAMTKEELAGKLYLDEDDIK